MSVVKKGPDVDMAAKVGDPTLVDPTPIAANQETIRTTREAMGLPAGDHSLSVEAVGTGTPGANEPAPRSDSPTPASTDPFARTNTTADPNELKPTAPANELKPGGTPDPNELTPTPGAQTAASSQPAPAPVQVNEIQSGQANSSTSQTASADASSSLATDKDISSSKKKKKKGLKKILTF